MDYVLTLVVIANEGRTTQIAITDHVDLRHSPLHLKKCLASSNAIHEQGLSLAETGYLDRIFEIRMVRFFVFFIKLLTSVSVIAAQSIANIIKSSLGPLGLDKMLVDNIGVLLYFPAMHSSKLISIDNVGSYDIQ